VPSHSHQLLLLYVEHKTFKKYNKQTRKRVGEIVLGQSQTSKQTTDKRVGGIDDEMIRAAYGGNVVLYFINSQFHSLSFAGKKNIKCLDY
jgi:hypothetical protein